MIDLETIPSTPVIGIIGPTAIGKSDLAIRIARSRGADVASADAIQVYRRLDIGSAKVSREVLAEIPHHFVDIRNPDDPFSVGDFLSGVEPLISRAHHGGPPLVICGGTGMYIHSLLHRYRLPQVAVDPSVRSQLAVELVQLGSVALWERLRAVDPEIASEIHPNHSSRIVRALELVVATGRPVHELRTSAPIQRTDCVMIGLHAKREYLWRRISQRVDMMVATGLIEEVRQLLTDGYSSELASLQSLGYKETVAYLNGKLGSLDALKTEIYYHTRQFAKRQMTWFKRIQNVQWIEVG